MVYECFEFEDDLLLSELLRRGFADLAGAVRAAREDAPAPEGALYGVARAYLRGLYLRGAYLRFAWNSPNLYQACITRGPGILPRAADPDPVPLAPRVVRDTPVACLLRLPGFLP